MIGLLCLKWRLKTSFNLLERNKTWRRINETIINNLTSPLLLAIIFFMMQNVGVPLWNCLTKEVKFGLEYGNKPHLH
jgi:hypothetical protein